MEQLVVVILIIIIIWLQNWQIQLKAEFNFTQGLLSLELPLDGVGGCREVPSASHGTDFCLAVSTSFRSAKGLPDQLVQCLPVAKEQAKTQREKLTCPSYAGVFFGVG